MDALTVKLCHLQHCRGIYLKHLMKLLAYEPNLEDLYQWPPTLLKSILQFSSKQFDLFYHDFQHINIHSILHLYRKHQIGIISINDHEYPYLLKHTYQPPLILYTQGNIALLKKRSLAIVGSRKANGYAEKAIEQLVPQLIAHNIVITSGLAKGVDSMAHRAAIKFNGRTIAVLGSGLFHIYPREHLQLYERLKQNDLIISEYPPYMRAQKWFFPERNRIISGISQGVLIVQAEKKSGSLITADYALQEGREVFCIPGALFDPLSEGTLRLIQEGAKLVLTSKDILDEYL
ncbi:DNA-processing protein DprA [Heyndrickxia ginsengihumi]|uniref:DNA processing protein DprA n=1 Tax=Heyndrickxia ginsengihumi TaxID=363870 RepID=A0A0A6VFA9_9BACI|nr:DNA-processing protein DprA [Heyndrickxia ginsengihumi]KHD86153.1 DNA processing protein DprA [Heyndrickxia ginsengihumi]MBE6183873.1 DNA-protecting protein DprA [Bacillus sp. (in: firmicutes)]MCM3022481.1 DNA-processing protein DprA [Heyndrickxia ginsengihumi]NEY19601.1 DNA-protecting protein DprA [Heyndrickxia ginsengihumi]